MRRSDNALMGLIWARNHDSGDPLERVRLAHFTPMVDILANVREDLTEDEAVALPTYSAQVLARVVDVRNPQDVVPVDMSQDPWSVHARGAIQQHCQDQADLIRSHFGSDGVPVSGTVLDRHQRLRVSQNPISLNSPSTNISENLGVMGSSVVAADSPNPPRSDGDGSISTLRLRDELLLGMELSPSLGLSLPGLSTLSSTPSKSSVADETSEAVSTGNDVQIIKEGDIDRDELLLGMELSPSPGLLLLGISTLSLTPSNSSVADETSEAASTSNDVQIIEDGDIDQDMPDVEEPIRAKARFSSQYPGLLRLNHVSA
jgi:hypothetical protein